MKTTFFLQNKFSLKRLLPSFTVFLFLTLTAFSCEKEKEETVSVTTAELVYQMYGIHVNSNIECSNLDELVNDALLKMTKGKEMLSRVPNPSVGIAAPGIFYLGVSTANFLFELDSWGKSNLAKLAVTYGHRSQIEFYALYGCN